MNLREDSNKKFTTDIRKTLVLILSICLVSFHVYTGAFGSLVGYIQAPVHWAFISTIAVLVRPSKFRGGMIYDGLLIVCSIAMSAYNIKLQEYLIMHPSKYNSLDTFMAYLSVVVAILIGYKVLGKALPTIAIVFILYAATGNNIPGMFQTAVFSPKRISTYLYTMGDGLFGSTLMVSARFLMLFLFFGRLMEMSGTGQFFVDIANAVAGRVRGGPAQAAVYSSMLMGLVSGSGAANVATTGVFTIPLMKKSGYSPSVAGAVEATASCGGQIMPPVMGAVAFLMSETTGIPYSRIATAALLPAVLYYISLSAAVYGFARHENMARPDPSALPSLKNTLKGGWYFLIPLFTIIALIYSGKSSQRSVFWAIVAIIAVMLIFRRDCISLPNMADACYKAATAGGPLAAACMLSGIIMGMINLTGLGLKITTIIEAIANGRLLTTLLLAMLTSVLLGMGLPTSAAYVVLSVLIAPSLLEMGVDLLPAHLFLLYYGALSTITPPVALSTFTAAGISGAGIWETGRDAIKLSAAGFIVPFIFVYSQELLMVGEIPSILLAMVTAILGCWFIGSSVSGWCMADLSKIARVILFVCGIMMIVVHPYWINFVGFGIALGIIVFGMMKEKTAMKKANG